MKLYLAPLLFLIFSLSGCPGNASKMENNGVSTKKEPTRENDPQKNDAIGPAPDIVYFKGVGTEPFWGVEISGEEIKFTSMTNDFETFTAPAVEPIRAADANVKMYAAGIEEGDLKVKIVKGDCSDGMSDKKYGYRVTVQIKGRTDADFKTFEGCGDYITDYRLNDIWVLEKIGEETVTTSDFPNEFPRLEINARENTFFGFGGCNRLTGSIFSERELLRFTAASTLMACQDTKESQFMKALNSSVSYSIGNNRLRLSNPDGILLVFKKMD